MYIILYYLYYPENIVGNIKQIDQYQKSNLGSSSDCLLVSNECCEVGNTV